MPKVFISGSSGVGKTTVIKKIGALGYAVVDGDDYPDLVQLRLQSTGEPVDWPKGYVDWSRYTLDINAPMLEDILNSNETIFLCGYYGNQPDFYHLFDYLFVLTVTPEIHRQHLYNRPARSAGDHDDNIQERMEKYNRTLQRFLDAGFVQIDNNGVPEIATQEILKRCGLA